MTAKRVDQAGVVALLLLLCPAAWCEIGGIVVTSAASFERGMPARGSIASVFCTGVQVDGMVWAEALPLPWSLGGVRVWVGGAPAPLFAVAAGQGYQQIDIQVPQEAQSDGRDMEVIVEQGGERGSARVPLLLTSPGEFFRWPGTDRGVFQHWPDYSLVTPENPARPGETLITYLTGMPRTSPTVPSGQASPFEPLARVPSYCIAYNYCDKYTVEEAMALGFEGTALWVGLVPGLVGVYQINFVLPASAVAGDKRVVLKRQFAAMFVQMNSYFSSPVTLPVR
ncbi:MAG TPA: hypothetical protein VLH09_10445 [Bryobacteraceae bacterium]|nr:hypothetical protein [Bryobacteraceae bacterium]